MRVRLAERLGCWLALAFASGAILGAIAMFYLLKLGIVSPDFNPMALCLVWLVVPVSWLLGRLAGTGRGRPEGPHGPGGAEGQQERGDG
jgi:hypothetical protein